MNIKINDEYENENEFMWMNMRMNLKMNDEYENEDE